MLPVPSRTELKRRLPRLIVGLVLFGLGIAMMVLSNLGLSPWEVLHQGISLKTGIPLGTVGIITGALVLVLWIPLGERPGIGTVANVVLIGIVIDVTLLFVPDTVSQLWLRWVLLLGGTLVIAIGTGLYIGAGLGPGPRDGLMTGLGKKGIPIGLARAVIEVTVLVIGYLLGGTVGIGTVIFAFGVGPLVQVILPALSLDPVTPRQQAEARATGFDT
ncbi:MAG: YczE/YyaS/YitT family protein [Acidimicrobiia bacterium]